LLETDSEVELDSIKKEATSFLELKNFEDIFLYNSKPIIHKLSHQHLYTRFWIVLLHSEMDYMQHILEIKEKAVPVLIGNFIDNFSPFNNP